MVDFTSSDATYAIRYQNGSVSDPVYNYHIYHIYHIYHQIINWRYNVTSYFAIPKIYEEHIGHVLPVTGPRGQLTAEAIAAVTEKSEALQGMRSVVVQLCGGVGNAAGWLGGEI